MKCALMSGQRIVFGKETDITMSNTSDVQEAARRIAAREVDPNDDSAIDGGSEGDGAEGVAPPAIKKNATEHPRGGSTPRAKEIGATEQEMDRRLREKMGWDQAKPGNPASVPLCDAKHGGNSARTTSPKVTSGK
jgi:hypothetical protein